MVGKTIHVVGALAALAAISGCQPGGWWKVDDIAVNNPPANNSIVTGNGTKVDLGGDNFKTQYEVAKKDCGTDQACHGAAKTARNAIALQILGVSDRVCETHLADIQATNAYFNLGLASITNVTAGLATFVGGGVTSQALSASAAMASGSRSLVNEQIYSQQVGPVITRLIRDNRARQGIGIRENLNKPVADYPVDGMLFDVGAYHYSCSFSHGIELISRAASNQKKTRADIEVDINTLERAKKSLEAEIQQTKENKKLDQSVAASKEAELIKIQEMITEKLKAKLEAP